MTAHAEGNKNLRPREPNYPTKVKPKLEMVTGWARNGLSNGQIALNLGVGESTFDKYIADNDELKDALRLGREDAEVAVENALFKRAVGYKFAEKTWERRKVMDENDEWTGQWEMVLVKKVVKNVVPDVEAQKYWLEHRAPKRWEKNPMPGQDLEKINAAISTLAQLLINPVKPREIDS